MRFRCSRSWHLVAGVVLVSACSGSGSGDATSGTARVPEPNRVPGAAWETVAPGEVGLDGAELEEIAKVAEVGKSHCLVVVRDGRIAGEWYFRDTTAAHVQNVFSATKSVTSTLVGIAADDGDLRMSDPASEWIPEWEGSASEAVTVRNLLSNDSGREWSLATDYGGLLQAQDRSAFAVGLSQTSAPGTVWAYNNAAIQTLQPVLAGATGADVVEYARRRLFEPLGMADTEMGTDPSGHALMFEGLRSTCRDLARFGVLFLERGRWGDRQVVSEDWVEQATGRSSTRLNAAYGYLWWLNRYGVLASPLAATSLDAAANPTTAQGRLVEDAPADMFWALGLGNQIVQVDPGSRTVVVRLGTAEARPQPPTFGPTEASRVVTDAVTGPVPAGSEG